MANCLLLSARTISSSLVIGAFGLLLSMPACAQPTARPAVPAPKPKAKPKVVPLADRIRSPQEADRPITEKLRSPRETLKSLYFAVLLYDLFPAMIDDALACLDLDALQPRPADQDAAMLALDLEYVLGALALPLTNVPDLGESVEQALFRSTSSPIVPAAYADKPLDHCTLYDADGIQLVLHRCPDGGWRFDADTLRRLPAFRRVVAERRKQRPAADLSALREGQTDPRATLRQFQIDFAHGDYYAAARALDLSALSTEQRRQQGPALAQQLAFVMQRRSYLFRQEVPDQPDGPAYTWHADKNGRIVLERVRQSDGKDAWLFTRQTVRNVPKMYSATQGAEPDFRYVRLGIVVPPLGAGGAPAVQQRPEEVPAHLGSPRALLQGFFRTMEAAEVDDTRLAEALEYLDLDNVPAADRPVLGAKLATQLDAVLRKLNIDLRTIPNDWNAGPQVLGEAQGAHIEIVRGRDGTWGFSDRTIARVPELFEKFAGKTRSDQGRGSSFDSARETLISFQTAARRRDFITAAKCLNLDQVHVSARDELGPVLAFKLQYVLERIGRIFVQEVSDNPKADRCVLHRSELGRLVLDRRPEDPGKGQWQFTPESVQQIEVMFRGLLGKGPEVVDEGIELIAIPTLQDTPAAWLRLKLSAWAQTSVGRLDLYQWLGLLLAAVVSWVAARVTMAGVTAIVAWLLRRSGSALTSAFVAGRLRPLTWLATVWVVFLLLQVLDLPIGVAGPVFAAKKFLLAGMAGWLGVRLMDLSMALYTNTEFLRPHRSLSDMIVPVSVRIGKTVVLLVVSVYIIYQVGEFDLLGRFLTGLGVAGLAASLAAQDAMKSYFGTLLLIGERAFKIGDEIIIGDKKGIVEQVGFRSTRLRTSEGSLLTVPNSLIAAAAIDNMGARTHHRFRTAVVLSPETPFDRALELRAQLQAWIEQQSVVARDKIDVHVHEVSGSGVEVQVELFLAAATPGVEARFREAFVCEVLGLASTLGVDVTPAYRRSVAETMAAAKAA